MDQVRMFLAGVKKYHFWILCVVVVLLGVGTWYMSVSDLYAQMESNKTKIKTGESDVKTVKDTQKHPNTDYEAGMDDIIKRYKYNIANEWQERYERQAKLLVWPESLGEDFINEFDPIRPIETIAYPTPPELEKSFASLQKYRAFITDELPKLAETIGGKWYVEVTGNSASGSSGPGGGATMQRPVNRSPGNSSDPGGEEDVDNSIVFWNPSNQSEILELHFGFASRGLKPSTLEVLYAQEDMWVLQALMNIIKATNGDATANYEAAIKDIESIQIGRTVRGRMGKVSQIVLKQQSAGGTGPGMLGGVSPTTMGALPQAGSASTSAGPSANPATAMPTGPGAPGAPADLTAALDPAFGRYVDVNYDPLPPQTLRDAPKSADKNLAIYSVAKRIPVRMRLIMDQRKLNDLLAECGNSSLPVEVRQVRINCPEGLASDEGGGGSSMSPLSGGGTSSYGGSTGKSSYGLSGGSSSSSKRPGRSSRGGSGPGMGSAGTEGETTVDPNEVSVEVYGIVYIYNPVNEQQLKVELQKSSAPAPTVPPPATPPVDPTAVAPKGATPAG